MAAPGTDLQSIMVNRFLNDFANAYYGVNKCLCTPATEDDRKTNRDVALKAYGGVPPILDEKTQTKLKSLKFDTLDDAWRMGKAAFAAYEEKPADRTATAKMTLKISLDIFTYALFRDETKSVNSNAFNNKGYRVCVLTLRKLKFQDLLTSYVSRDYITAKDATFLETKYVKNLHLCDTVRVLATKTCEKYCKAAHRGPFQGLWARKIPNRRDARCVGGTKL